MSDWRSKETAPAGDSRRGPRILVWSPETGIQMGYAVRFYGGEIELGAENFSGEGWGFCLWQHLPEPPK